MVLNREWPIHTKGKEWAPVPPVVHVLRNEEPINSKIRKGHHKFCREKQQHYFWQQRWLEYLLGMYTACGDLVRFSLFRTTKHTAVSVRISGQDTVQLGNLWACPATVSIFCLRGCWQTLFDGECVYVNKTPSKLRATTCKEAFPKTVPRQTFTVTMKSVGYVESVCCFALGLALHDHKWRTRG